MYSLKKKRRNPHTSIKVNNFVRHIPFTYFNVIKYGKYRDRKVKLHREYFCYKNVKVTKKFDHMQ